MDTQDALRKAQQEANRTGRTVAVDETSTGEIVLRFADEPRRGVEIGQVEAAIFAVIARRNEIPGQPPETRIVRPRDVEFMKSLGWELVASDEDLRQAALQAED